MQNYGGYYSQYPQGQNQMYQTPGGQNNANQSNMRNMFGGPTNYGGSQMPQMPQQQYGYQQQQMPQQQNFVFHFDLNNGPPNMNMNMGPYAPSNPPQFGGPIYGGPQMQPNGQQKKEDKNDELFNSFDPFNPKPKTSSKPWTQPQQNSVPQQPAAPAQPKIQLIEDTTPKKQDLNAFRSAFASLAAPSPQPQVPQQPQQQSYGFGGQPNSMYPGGMQGPAPPQIEGFNFVGGSQNVQTPQIEGFNFGSNQQPQSSPFNQTSSQQPQANQFPNQSFPQQQSAPFPNQPPQQQSSQPVTPVQNASLKSTQDDPFSNFNPISSPQQKASSQEQISDFSSGFMANNQVPPGGLPNNNASQPGGIDGFSFNQPQVGSNGPIQSFNQPQVGSGTGIQSFNQQQTGSNGQMQSFNQPQTGSGGILSFNTHQPGSSDVFSSFNNSQAKSSSGFPINQPQTGSGGGFTSFNQPQPGSAGGIPHSNLDNLFGPSPLQQQSQPNAPNTSTSNPFLSNQSSSNNFMNPNQNQDQSNTTSNPFITTPNTNSPVQQQQQQGSNGGMVFSTFEPPQNQQQTLPSRTTASSFGDSFRQAIGETSLTNSPVAAPSSDSSKPKENETSDFKNIFSQGHNFFEHQEEQLKAQEGFTFNSQTPNADSQAPNFSNFVFNSESNQNSQFGNSTFANFGSNETQQQPTPQSPTQPNQEPPSPTPFAPFGVTDLQPISNSTFVINSSEDSLGSQPIIQPAKTVDESKIPYFVEQEKKMELENRIKNDSMSVFDPFNPNPQPQQQQESQPVQQENPQNEQKKKEEPKVFASVNASVDAIRNIFGGPSEPEEENKKDEEKPEENPPATKNDEQQSENQNDNNQNMFFGNFSNGFGADNNKDESQNKSSFDIQLNVGLGQNNDTNNNEDNPFAVKGEIPFQNSFGTSPEGNHFGFGGFGFDNSFGKGNVFQNVFEQGDMNKPATFADFFPNHNSQPLTPPIPTDDKTENKENTQQPPKSVTPFAPTFDLMDITSQHQNDNQKQSETEKPKEQQAQQQNIDFDNPFLNQDSVTMFGQASGTPAPAAKQPSEPFNPFGNSNATTSKNNSNLNLTLETQSTFSLSESSNEIQKESISQIENINQVINEPKKKSAKGSDIFDEIPDDVSEIDKTLPEKPPPFIMPTIGDNSSNPFTNVLANSSATSNPFTTSSNNTDNKDNPFILNQTNLSSNPFATQNSTTTKDKANEIVDPFASPKDDNKENNNNDSNPFASQFSTANEQKDNTNPFTLETKKNEAENENKKNNDFGDFFGFGFSSSTKPDENIESSQKKDDNPFFGGSFNNAFSNQTETKTETTEKESTEDQKTDKETTKPDTSEFTFTSASVTTDSKDANPFSKGFNPFGGDFSNPFTTSTSTTTNETDNNNSQAGGFTFNNEDDKRNKEEESKSASPSTEQKQENEAENTKEQTEEKPDKDSTSNKNNEQENNNENFTVNDTLDDDLFDMNSIEEFKPKPQRSNSDNNSDLFGDIHTFPASNSTSDFLEMKQKKEGKHSSAASNLQSDGGSGGKSSILSFSDKGHQNNNISIISIIDPYSVMSQDLPFSASDESEDPAVLEIMSEESPMGKILKKFVKPPENDFYGSFEKDPHPIRIFPKFDDTKAAKVLAEFVSKQFGITPSFASTSKKQQEEIDVNSIFNAPAASEPNDDDDFLLMI